MSFFKQQVDIKPITIIISLFIFDIYLYIVWISGIFLALYLVFSIVSKWYISAWNHHHQHVNTFSLPILNRAIEIMYGLQTGAVWYWWVLHHNLWHHAHYQDQSKDESAWKSPQWKRYWAFMYSWIIWITAYYRMLNVAKKHKKTRKYFLNMCFIQIFILSILIVLQPLQGIVLFVIPMITSLFLTAYGTYDHHSGLEQDDPYKSSYNITVPRYNILTGNLWYHTAHHIKPSLHWSKLPAFHEIIADKIENKYYKKYTMWGYSQGEW